MAKTWTHTISSGQSSGDQPTWNIVSSGGDMAWPIGTVTGDFVVVMISTASGPYEPQWGLGASTVTGGGTWTDLVDHFGAGGSYGMDIQWADDISTSSDTTFEETSGTANGDELAVTVLRIDQDDLVDPIVVSHSEANGSGSNPNPAAITGLDNAKSYAVAVCFTLDGGDTLTSFASTYNADTNTEQHSGQTTSELGPYDDDATPSSGSIDPAASTNGAVGHCAFALAIELVAAGGGANPVGPLGHPLMGPLGGPL